jgi:3-oxoacyl-[acyl-carrier protein] reductase
MRRFDSINVGDTAELQHTISTDDVDAFVNLTGDDNKIHVDPAFAKTTPLKRPVVHGMLGASFISTVIGTKLPGDGALWFSQSLEFLLPVRVGDIITVKAEVTRKIPREQVIELTTIILNQNGQRVTTGIAKVKVVEAVSKEDQPKRDGPRKCVALVVGGTGGIGSAVALQLAHDGFDIAIHYFKNRVKADELHREILSLGRSCRSYQADVTCKEQIASLVEGVLRHFETITVLVNCATTHVVAVPFAQLDWNSMQMQVDSVLRSAFYLAHAVTPIMKQNKKGTIINLTTQYTEGTPPPELIPYIAAKSALNGFSKALAVELASSGVTVNMVSPGMTDTDLIADVPEKARLMSAARTPLRRLACPDDVAGAVSYLASVKASFLTGETIRVNGGQLMQ